MTSAANFSGSSSPWDCIVIGAGMSGLSAALKLQQDGHKTLLLEARNRIGGRIDTHSHTDGLPCPVDFGASFVHGVDGNPLVELAKKYNVKLARTFDEGIAFGPQGKQLPDEVSEKIQANVWTSFFGHSRETSRAVLPPAEKSLADFLLAPGSPVFDGLETEDEKDYAAQAVNGLDGWTGGRLNDVSLRYWGFERDFEGADKAIPGGYRSLLAPIQDEFLHLGGEIKLKEKVDAIKFDDDAELVNIFTSSGSEYVTQSCICTLPLGVLQHDPPIFTPPLPPRRLESLRKLGFGLLDKIIISYPDLWWPKGVSMIECFQSQTTTADGGSSIHESLAKRALFAHSMYTLTGHPVIIVFLGGDAGEEAEKLSDAQAQAWLHSVLSRCFLTLPGAPAAAPEPSACHVTRWRGDPLAHGSYAYIPVARPGEEPASPLDMVELSKPLWGGRLGFAGEHTDMDHYASVHGALLSGWREAARVNAALEGSWKTSAS